LVATIPHYHRLATELASDSSGNVSPSREGDIVSEDRALGLSELGRRIERLFYLGALLTVVCAIQLYVVTTLSFIRRDNPASYAVLAEKLQTDLPQLREAFERRAAPVSAAPKPSSALDRNRARLGLPPALVPSAGPTPRTYHQLIASIISETARYTGLSEVSLESLTDEKNPPDALIDQIRSKARSLAAKPVTVWGIETPITVPLQYGDAKYEVPTSFIATCLRVALAPLVLGWLISFYATRKRELGLIRTSTSYFATFPHLLNLFPLRPAQPSPYWNARVQKQRAIYLDRMFDRVVLSLGRTVTLLIITVPMVLLGAYAESKLAAISEDLGAADIIVPIVVIGLAILSIGASVIQEWTRGLPKEFVQS
jgi:hypothetical protein